VCWADQGRRSPASAGAHALSLPTPLEVVVVEGGALQALEPAPRALQGLQEALACFAACCG
jgi:hypothetical protein